jgi:hypothetical protein
VPHPGTFCQTSSFTNNPGVMADPLFNMTDLALGTAAKGAQKGLS